jgi:hypothetical protein
VLSQESILASFLLKLVNSQVSPNQFAKQVQTLINCEVEHPFALRKINNKVQQPLRSQKKRLTGDQANKKCVGASVSGQPPFPTQCQIFPRAFLYCDFISLQWVVSKKMACCKKEKNIQKGWVLNLKQNHPITHEKGLCSLWVHSNACAGSSAFLKD